MKFVNPLGESVNDEVIATVFCNAVVALVICVGITIASVSFKFLPTLLLSFGGGAIATFILLVLQLRGSINFHPIAGVTDAGMLTVLIILWPIWLPALGATLIMYNMYNAMGVLKHLVTAPGQLVLWIARKRSPRTGMPNLGPYRAARGGTTDVNDA